LIVLSACVAVAMGYPRPLAQGPGPIAAPRDGGLQIPGAAGYGTSDGYFQYINVPAPKEFEWGYRRGNPDHNREEYLSQKDHTFKAKLKWSDEYGGHGEHYYDINHVSAYKEPVHHEPAYAPPKPAYDAGRR